MQGNVADVAFYTGLALWAYDAHGVGAAGALLVVVSVIVALIVSTGDD